MEREITPMPRMTLFGRFIQIFSHFFKTDSKEVSTKVRLTVYKMPDETFLARISAPGKIISEPPGGVVVFSITSLARNKRDLNKLKRKAEKKAMRRGIEKLVW